MICSQELSSGAMNDSRFEINLQSFAQFVHSDKLSSTISSLTFVA